MINQTQIFVEALWDNSIVPTISKYIEIPCKSVAFDPDWEKHGYIDQAMQLIEDWCHALDLKDMELTIYQEAGRTPLLLIDVPGRINKSVLMYGHMDKQPEMVGWDDDLGPWKPVIKDNRLYGRGGADDGYAVFAALASIKALQEQGEDHPHCTILIEASEESGSRDLPFYIDKLKDQVPEPDLIICLDSGAGDYDRLWVTTSLRGLLIGTLTVEILTEGVHSGEASGIVPSSFRIARQLFNRIEDEKTGEILVNELKVDIPQERIEEAKCFAEQLGSNIWKAYPWVEHAGPDDLSGYQMALNRTWRSALSYTGIGHMPAPENAGSVLRPKTSFVLSFRIPPMLDHKVAGQVIKNILEKNPPYGARVKFDLGDGANGWNAPKTAPWLLKAISNASEVYYGKPALFWGEGGSIPFMQMLGEKYPKAQFLITGVLGPHSNAHGPNEFLDINMAKRLTCCISDVLKSI